MNQNFTQFAFTDSVKELQSKHDSRQTYQRMEKSGDRFVLGPSEISFIQDMDSFFLSTVGENGWPYAQYRGGPKGFLKIEDVSAIRMADYSGNRQYISSGNINSSNKVCLFLIDFARKQRLKIWAEATIEFAEDIPEIVAELEDPTYKAKIERVFTFQIKAFDWNCPKYITQRFTLEELRESPELISGFA